jgi:L-malate glycosyltransferase
MSMITVLFATFNGAHTLPRMLDQLERLQPPTGGWEVIAVDNGSSDDSLKIMTERAKRLRMTVLSEPRRGKNVALNAALPLANGDIIAFTDDDIILSPDWLVCIEKIAAQQPEYDIFGGPIYPVWEKPAPDWVLRNAPKGFLGWTDFPEGPIDAIQIWGGNMAVRAVLFRDSKFDEDRHMHSETEFTNRANRRGHQCWHFHAAPAGHIIRSYQLELEYFLQRSYRCGREDRRIWHNSRRELIERAYRLTSAAYQCAKLRFFGEFDTRFKAAMELSYWQGFWSTNRLRWLLGTEKRR